MAKAIFGQQAGAAAVVMTNNAAGLPPFEGQITSNPDTGESRSSSRSRSWAWPGNQATAGTPSFKLRAAGQPARPATSSRRIDLPNPNFTGFASFSSGGPRNGDSP